MNFKINTIIMKRLYIGLYLLSLFTLSVFAQHKTVTIKLIETTDIHGNFFPYDFISNKPYGGSLSRICSFVDKQREQFGKNDVLLLDNGDILQGQPSAYYANYIDTTHINMTARIMNFMHYDVASLGNHDIETGHAVYDKFRQNCDFPVLSANMINNATRVPYCQPYQMFYRDGIRIAVLGMITPAIPAWLSETLWQGITFDDMVKTAKKWIPIIKEREHPDLIVGLFHSGRADGIVTDEYKENESETVAREVPGFDLVFFGHDHTCYCKEIENNDHKRVWLVDAAKSGFVVGDVTATFTLQDDTVISKKLSAQLTDMDAYSPSPEFMTTFKTDFTAVKQYIDEPIGKLTADLSADHCLFGPSLLLDFIQQMQLSISGADISITAPLTTSGKVSKGTIYMRNMFTLYRFENGLYKMRLTGREVKDELEYSYGLWFNQMKKPSDHLLLLEGDRLKNYSFNFDSAAGIKYEVDVSKPVGERVHIISMSNGQPFSLTKTYMVAVNSYRGNGGGELLTRGAGIPKADLIKRIVWTSDKDLRYYMMQYIKSKKEIKPVSLNNWCVIPKSWAQEAAKRDAALLLNK